MFIQFVLVSSSSIIWFYTFFLEYFKAIIQRGHLLNANEGKQYSPHSGSKNNFNYIFVEITLINAWLYLISKTTGFYALEGYTVVSE